MHGTMNIELHIFVTRKEVPIALTIKHRTVRWGVIKKLER